MDPLDLTLGAEDVRLIGGLTKNTPKKKMMNIRLQKRDHFKKDFFIFQALIFRGCVSLAGSKNVNHETSFFNYFQGNPKS